MKMNLKCNFFNRTLCLTIQMAMMKKKPLEISQTELDTNWSKSIFSRHRAIFVLSISPSYYFLFYSILLIFR